jgi:hypothetical protein
MLVEPVGFLGGERGRDFVIYDELGLERFSARLMDGSRDLIVTWTDHVPWTVLRLRDVQTLADGPGSFIRIRGIASDELELSIQAGTFDMQRAGQMLTRGLSGKWQVQATPRSDIRPPVLEVIAERLEEE